MHHKNPCFEIPLPPRRVILCLVDSNTRYVELLHPTDEVELAFIKSVLNAEGLHYVVRNESFGGFYVGPQIELLNRKTVLVERADETHARELLSVYLNENAELIEEARTADPMPPDGIWMRIFDKVRLVFEVLFFGWLMPRHRNNRRKYD